MIAWITENAATILGIAAVLLLVGVALFSILRDRKNAKGECTGNCATCGMGCSCRFEKEQSVPKGKTSS